MIGGSSGCGPCPWRSSGKVGAYALPSYLLSRVHSKEDIIIIGKISDEIIIIHYCRA